MSVRLSVVRRYRVETAKRIIKLFFTVSHGVTPAPVQLQGHIVESTDRFTYLGSDIHSSERSTPEILRRIGLYLRQTGQRLEADRIEFTDEDTALQCPCHLRTVIWL